MKEWKIRQEIYHRLHKEYDDDLNKIDIVISEDIVGGALKHFKEYVDHWLYPAKSYFVAVCYAEWLSRDFNENFYDLLNDPLLLYGNDPYFKPYYEEKILYDEILKGVQRPIEMIGMVPHVRKYYESEIWNK